MDEPIKLSPSDLTFLWDECKRCFYLKYVHSIHRPSAPFPGIFSTIDRLMKGYYEGQPTEKLSSELPPGVIRFSERFDQFLDAPEFSSELLDFICQVVP